MAKATYRAYQAVGGGKLELVDTLHGRGTGSIPIVPLRSTRPTRSSSSRSMVERGIST